MMQTDPLRGILAGRVKEFKMATDNPVMEFIGDELGPIPFTIDGCHGLIMPTRI